MLPIIALAICGGCGDSVPAPRTDPQEAARAAERQQLSAALARAGQGVSVGVVRLQHSDAVGGGPGWMICAAGADYRTADGKRRNEPTAVTLNDLQRQGRQGDFLAGWPRFLSADLRLLGEWFTIDGAPVCLVRDLESGEHRMRTSLRDRAFADLGQEPERPAGAYMPVWQEVVPVPGLDAFLLRRVAGAGTWQLWPRGSLFAAPGGFTAYRILPELFGVVLVQGTPRDRAEAEVAHQARRVERIESLAHKVEDTVRGRSVTFLGGSKPSAEDYRAAVDAHRRAEAALRQLRSDGAAGWLALDGQGTIVAEAAEQPALLRRLQELAESSLTRGCTLLPAYLVTAERFRQLGAMFGDAPEALNERLARAVVSGCHAPFAVTVLSCLLPRPEMERILQVLGWTEAMADAGFRGQLAIEMAMLAAVQADRAEEVARLLPDYVTVVSQRLGDATARLPGEQAHGRLSTCAAIGTALVALRAHQGTQRLAGYLLSRVPLRVAEMERCLFEALSSDDYSKVTDQPDWRKRRDVEREQQVLVRVVQAIGTRRHGAEIALWTGPGQDPAILAIQQPMLRAWPFLEEDGSIHLAFADGKRGTASLYRSFLLANARSMHDHAGLLLVQQAVGGLVSFADTDEDNRELLRCVTYLRTVTAQRSASVRRELAETTRTALAAAASASPYRVICQLALDSVEAPAVVPAKTLPTPELRACAAWAVRLGAQLPPDDAPAQWLPKPKASDDLVPIRQQQERDRQQAEDALTAWRKRGFAPIESGSGNPASAPGQASDTETYWKSLQRLAGGENFKDWVRSGNSQRWRVSP